MENNKIFAVLLLVLMIVSTVCACRQELEPNETNDSLTLPSVDITEQNQTKDIVIDDKKGIIAYKPLIYDFSDSITAAKYEMEYSLVNMDKYLDVIPDEKVNMLINGNNIEADFRRISIIAPNYFPTYRYYSKEDDTSVMTDEKGKMIGFYQHKTVDFNEDEVCSENDCLQIAKEYLSQYVDVSEYSIQVEKTEDKQLYEFSFTKYIGDFMTTDNITIGVFYNGEIKFFSSFMMGRVPAETSTEDIDMERIHSSVNQKLDQIYQRAKQIYDIVEYTEPSYALTVLSDGTRAIEYSLEVKCILEDAEGRTVYADRINMIIPVD